MCIAAEPVTLDVAAPDQCGRFIVDNTRGIDAIGRQQVTSWRTN